MANNSLDTRKFYCMQLFFKFSNFPHPPAILKCFLQVFTIILQQLKDLVKTNYTEATIPFCKIRNYISFLIDPPTFMASSPKVYRSMKVRVQCDCLLHITVVKIGINTFFLKILCLFIEAAVFHLGKGGPLQLRSQLILFVCISRQFLKCYAEVI